MFGKQSNKETIIAGSCVLDSGLKTDGNIKIYGKINGPIIVEGDVVIGETGVIIGEVKANNITLSGTVEGNVHCKSTLKLTSSAKLTGDAYVKNFTSENGCLFGGKCVMEDMEKLIKKGDKVDKNFDMSTPKKTATATIISELENTEKENTEKPETKEKK